MRHRIRRGYTVVHLLRAVRDIRLLNERRLPGVLQFDNGLNRRPALRLGFERHSHEPLKMLLLGLYLGAACIAGKDGLQGRGLRYEHCFQRRKVAIAGFTCAVSQAFDHLCNSGSILAQQIRRKGLDNHPAIEKRRYGQVSHDFLRIAIWSHRYAKFLIRIFGFRLASRITSLAGTRSFDVHLFVFQFVIELQLI